MKRHEVSLLLMLFLVTAAGCSRQEKSESKPVVYHVLRGQVVALDRVSSLITISHGTIPNFMEAMTMSFNIKDTTLFHGVEVGDSVSGVVAVLHTDMWLDSLAVVWKMPQTEASR